MKRQEEVENEGTDVPLIPYRPPAATLGLAGLAGPAAAASAPPPSADAVVAIVMLM